ncbi:hypothetical protein J6590_018586 [Homalodisca vitripennis]|nr:hypothetical protein J6590_018586 [Homalodisca vitripennis]
MLDGTSMCSQYRSCGILPDGSYAGPGPLTFTSNVGWDKHMQPIQELWDPARQQLCRSWTSNLYHQYRSCGILPDGSYAGPGPLTFTSNVGWDKHMQPIQELWDPARQQLCRSWTSNLYQ